MLHVNKALVFKIFSLKLMKISLLSCIELCMQFNIVMQVLNFFWLRNIFVNSEA